MIQLKRFSSQRSKSKGSPKGPPVASASGATGGGVGSAEKAVLMTSQKLDTPVAFPSCHLDLSPFTSPVLKRNNGQIPPPTPPAAAADTGTSAGGGQSGDRASQAAESEAADATAPTAKPGATADAAAAESSTATAKSPPPEKDTVDADSNGKDGGAMVDGADAPADPEKGSSERAGEKKQGQGEGDGATEEGHDEETARPPKLSRLLQPGYTLQAVVCHFGTLDRGHYIAYHLRHGRSALSSPVLMFRRPVWVWVLTSFDVGCIGVQPMR